MSQKHKALYQQLQLAGLGIVIAIIGLIKHRLDIGAIGAVFCLYGILRAWFIWKIVKQAEE